MECVKEAKTEISLSYSCSHMVITVVSPPVLGVQLYGVYSVYSECSVLQMNLHESVGAIESHARAWRVSKIFFLRSYPSGLYYR